MDRWRPLSNANEYWNSPRHSSRRRQPASNRLLFFELNQLKATKTKKNKTVFFLTPANLSFLENRFHNFIVNKNHYLRIKYAIALVKLSPHSTSLVTSRLDTTPHVRRVERVETSVSSRAVRHARHSQNAWARHVERVDCGVVYVVSRRNDPSGIWALHI